VHRKELQYLYISLNIIPVIISVKMRWTGHVACTRKISGAYRVFARKSDEKILVPRSRRRKEGNIKMDSQEVGSGRGLDPSSSG